MRIIVLFNLKPGVDAADYESWALTRDVPVVRSLPSVDDLTVYRVTGMLGSEGRAPFDYVEVIDVADMEGFGTDIASQARQAVAQEFGDWADAPVFMLTRELLNI